MKEDLEKYSEEHQDELQKVAEIMKKGDPRCDLKIGTRVMKINGDSDDLTPDGTKGTILGNLRVDMEAEDVFVKSTYLVKFDNSDNAKMTIDCRLRRLTFFEKLKEKFK